MDSLVFLACADPEGDIDSGPPPPWTITSFTDYTLHALWPYIDTEINHIRHFIKIKFVSKGIEFMILPNIVKDK